MQLPPSLQLALAQECASCLPQDLREAAARLTEHYQARRNSADLFQQKASRLAYLAVRMPATYAAIYRVLEEVRLVYPHKVKSLLDLGAGPGTGGWAVMELFSSVQSVTCIEQSKLMMELGQRLAQSSEWPPLAHASWYHQNLSQSLPKAEMALLSYLIGEMNPFERKLLFARLWDTGVDLVVVIEPGTPDGYRRILEVREWALAQGAYLVAPCPNHKACPMKGSDWCHFPARVERSKIHKWLKSGSMGYEDEKFSYLAFGREPVSLPIGRIVGKPIKATGVVRFPLCSEGSLQDALVSRKQGGYKKARDAKWGDLLINK